MTVKSFAVEPPATTLPRTSTATALAQSQEFVIVFVSKPAPQFLPTQLVELDHREV